MKSSDIFSGNSLKAEDIQGKSPIVTIEKVTVQSFKDNTSKPVVHFVGKDKSLVCNKTNWNAIVEITGCDDSDDWSGCRIKLVVALVDFQGKRVPAIRVEAPTAASAPQSQRRPVEPVSEPLDDSDVPF